MKTKQINLKKAIAFLMLICSSSMFAQMSYEEYQSAYKPHYEKLTPNAKLVTTVNDTDIPTGAAVIQLLLQKLEANSNDEDNKLNLVAIITSCNRDVVAKILKELPTKDAVQALLWVKESWIREAIYFVDKTTYHNLVPHLSAIKDWKGEEGPFGAEINNWAPIYAGIGLDKSWGGYKGINEYIDAYNNWPTKVNPQTGELLTLSEPLTKMGNTAGFGIFGAFYHKNKGFFELDYQNRSAKSIGGGTGFEKGFKFSSNTIGFSYLKAKKYAPTFMKFYSGWGLQFQTGSVKERNTFTTSNKWEKWGGGITAGINYNLGVFINPVKSIPVMIGAKAYAQINFLNYDMQFMEDRSPQIAFGGNGDEKLKGAHHLYGFQLQAIYKFGGSKKDNKTYQSFDEELAQGYDKSVNTEYSEITPRISPDGKTLYFIRADHPVNTKGSLNSQDIWMADVSNGIENATATHLDAPFNKGTFNSVAGVSPDENTLMIKGNYKNGESNGRGYSFMYRTKQGWSEPQGIEIEGYSTMAKGTYVGQYWSQDGKHLLLSMSESSTDDKQDIYVTHLEEDGTWSRPKSLGSTINTSGDEHSPFLASDGKTLYFSSDKDGGFGSNDIWFAKRLDDTWTKWSEPENAGDDINTEAWDAYYSIDASGKYAYMASGKNSKGGEDIVRIKLKEEVQPDPVVLVTGKVLDAKTNQPIEATITYNGLSDGKNYGIARTNPSTGEYKIVLPYGINYDFSANAPSYIGVSENLDLTGIGEYKEVKRDLSLVPIEVGSTVRLNNIFFETGSATLKSESYGELNRVVKFLNNNSTIKIELGGHTDNTGSESSNLKLSQQRVNSVMDYLLAQGVSADKMVAQGYGETKPVESNDTEEGKQRNRRVEFIILEK